MTKLHRIIGRGLALVMAFAVLCGTAAAAPYAEMVMDARTGQVLQARNADTRLHPASLTKMMTLYVAFDAIRRGEISLDTQVKISAKAAEEKPSKLGLRRGQRIALRYLIRAAAVKSANDAATAIGEAIEGSEAAFARRMNRTAIALGMTRTTFRNAHGLTEDGHLSTARDMTMLGRALIYGFPEYYNLFSRRTTDAGVREVANTNRRLLDAYAGADGIKTGYTVAAGFNLVASAERGDKRVVATVFGGRSTSTRNARIVELLDLGFGKAPSGVRVQPPVVATDGGAGKTIRLVRAPSKSPRPLPRPVFDPALVVAAESESAAQVEVADAESTTARTGIEVEAQALEIVTRLSTQGGRYWSISLGRHASRFEADKVLLTTAMQELETLDGALRKVVPKGGSFEANFVGLTEQTAQRACARIQARRAPCRVTGPSS